MAPRLVFVHGVGGPRRVEDDRRCWISALADGARRAGHSAAARKLEDGGLAHVVFAYYGSLFFHAQAQGLGGTSLSDIEAQMLVEFLAEIIERLRDDPEAAEQPDLDRQSLTYALAKLRPEGQPQGKRRAGPAGDRCGDHAARRWPVAEGRPVGGRKGANWRSRAGSPLPRAWRGRRGRANARRAHPRPSGSGRSGQARPWWWPTRSAPS